MSQHTRYYWQILVANEPVFFADLPIGSSFVLRLSWEDYQSFTQYRSRTLPTIMVKLSETESISTGIPEAKVHTFAAAHCKDHPLNTPDCHEVRRY